jgi:putative Ca2+/H+ antiporter (TMEM165/GDT1 family)
MKVNIVINGWWDLAKMLLRVICLAGVVGIALKLAYYVVMINVYIALLPNNIYAATIAENFFFPYFPNAFDCVFLIFATVFLAFEKRTEKKKETTT